MVSLIRTYHWSGRQDLNLRPFGPEPNALPNCATPRKNGANEGTRTPDLLITNQLLYRLSYVGSWQKTKIAPTIIIA